MTPEELKIEELKKTWLSMGEILGMNHPENSVESLNGKKTALDRLRNRYKSFQLVSIIMIVSSFMILSGALIEDSNLKFYLGISYLVYFLTGFTMDYWLWKGLGTINPVTMKVSQVIRKSMFYRKRHLQFIAVLMPMAIALIGFTGYIFSENEYFIKGIIAGVIFGLIVGSFQLHRFMSEYRKLME